MHSPLGFTAAYHGSVAGAETSSLATRTGNVSRTKNYPDARMSSLSNELYSPHSRDQSKTRSGAAGALNQGHSAMQQRLSTLTSGGRQAPNLRHSEV